MKNLEVQIGQLDTTINAQQKGTFPSNTEVNPKEQCKAIILREIAEVTIKGNRVHPYNSKQWPKQEQSRRRGDC